MSELKKFSFAQTVTPDLCGKEPKMQPPAAFMLFQNAASLHAEDIGNGTAALAERGLYWVATHSRIDFYDDARLMDKLTVSTWVNPAKPNAVRGYRGYDIFVGDRRIAEGLTEWVVLNRETGFVRFSEFGFPEGFEFQDYVACGGKLRRFRDEFSDDEEVYTFTVRTSNQRKPKRFFTSSLPNLKVSSYRLGASTLHSLACGNDASMVFSAVVIWSL